MIQSALSRLTHALARADSWTNFFTGLGNPLQDKTQDGSFQDSARLSDQELSAMYRGDAIARKIVTEIPQQMLRGGFQVVTANKVEAAAIQERCSVLGVAANMREAMIWGGLFGGAVVFVGVDDGRAPDQPLDVNNVRSVPFLQTYDRRFATADKWYTDPREPKYGQPSVYLLTNQDGRISWVHESRLVIFRGAHTDPQTQRALAGWDLSILQAPYEVIRAFWMSYKSGEYLMQDASQAVIKVRNLFNQIASGNLQDLITRAKFLDMSRSVARAMLLDADGGESFEKVATSFAGFPDMLDRFNNLLSAVTGHPVIVLMGQPRIGLGGNSESDIRIWYDRIESDREDTLKPRLEATVRLVALSLGIRSHVTIKFRSLWQENPQERAARELVEAQTDQIRIVTQVLDPDEVALARFTGEDSTIKIDPNTRLPPPAGIPPQAVPGALPAPPVPPPALPPAGGSSGQG